MFSAFKAVAVEGHATNLMAPPVSCHFNAVFANRHPRESVVAMNPFASQRNLDLSDWRLEAGERKAPAAPLFHKNGALFWCGGVWQCFLAGRQPVIAVCHQGASIAIRERCWCLRPDGTPSSVPRDSYRAISILLYRSKHLIRNYLS
ncbi:hypothetical protein D3C80_1115440 [compost metagenome]